MEAETEEGQLRRAYSIALKLKNSNLDSEAVYARLEKQGISEEIAKKVISDMRAERVKSKKAESKELENVAWIKILIGVMIIIFTAMFLPGLYILPVGLIISGTLYFLIKK